MRRKWEASVLPGRRLFLLGSPLSARISKDKAGHAYAMRRPGVVNHPRAVVIDGKNARNVADQGGGKRRGVVFLTLARVSSRAIGSTPKKVGELCHAEALFQAKASEQSLTRLRVCRHVSLDGKRCVRIN